MTPIGSGRPQHNISHPVFWNLVDGEWQYRTMFENVPLPLDWPVYVSHAEASAYARWAGKALPTEAQWHRAAYGTPEGTERPYPWGSEAPDRRFGNFDFESWDPTPVGAFRQGAERIRRRRSGGQRMGVDRPPCSRHFPVFSRSSSIPDIRPISSMAQHYVMKGGSARTAACMLRRSFRNWFQPHYQYVYAGFRCVRS